MKRIALALAFLLVPAAALAQQVPYAYPITVGTSPVQVLSSDTARKQVTFFNPNATALIAVCPSKSRVDSSNITCAINGAGSITILPYASVPIAGVGQNGAVPSSWNAISDTVGAHLTILEWE